MRRPTLAQITPFAVLSKNGISYLIGLMGVGISLTDFPQAIRWIGGVLGILVLVSTLAVKVETWLKKRHYRHQRSDDDFADRVWEALKEKAERDEDLDPEKVEQMEQEFEQQTE